MMKLDDLPTHIDGLSAWTGPQMLADPDIWRTSLSTSDIDDLMTALAYFESTGKNIGEITVHDFSLPRFGAHLAQLKHKLIHGCGVEVIRGFPMDGLSQAQKAAIFCGIGAHLGTVRSQNAAGHILGHVRDLGADPNDPNSRIYQTNARQSFHTDSADVVGLMCLRPAQEGGTSLLVSAHSIYNRMRAEAPELLLKLFDPIATDRRGEVPDGMNPWMDIPVLNWHEGYLTVFYQRQYIDSAQRFDGAMKLTPEHVAALDMFDALANDPEYCFGMDLVSGDMQFVYNHNQLHDRTGFLDWPEPQNRRHLFRLWLSLEGDRPLPEVFAQRYGDLTIGDRGGIITAHTRLHAPLDDV